MTFQLIPEMESYLRNIGKSSARSSASQNDEPRSHELFRFVVVHSSVVNWHGGESGFFGVIAHRISSFWHLLPIRPIEAELAGRMELLVSTHGTESSWCIRPSIAFYESIA